MLLERGLTSGGFLVVPRAHFIGIQHAIVNPHVVDVVAIVIDELQLGCIDEGVAWTR